MMEREAIGVMLAELIQKEESEFGRQMETADEKRGQVKKKEEEAVTSQWREEGCKQ